MPQFIDSDGNLLALWVEITADDGTINSYSNLRLIWDKAYSLSIEPLHEAAPTFDFKTVQSRISDFIQRARTEALRILTEFGVTQDDLDFGQIVLRVKENGEIPAGVYAASRIVELTGSVSFTEEKIHICNAHSLALTAQYVLGDRDFLQKELTNYCINQSEIAKKKRGTIGPLKRAIIILSPNDLPDLIEKFKNDDVIEDMYESTIDSKRIDVHQIEVYEDENIITYLKRSKVERKKVTFRRLGDIIREIKK